MTRAKFLSRSADRAAMADRLAAACSAAGGRTLIEPSLDGCLYVTLRAPGDALRLHVMLEPHPYPELLGSWVSERRLRPSFGGDVNPHHGCKATVIGDPEALIAAMRRGFALAASGEAFA